MPQFHPEHTPARVDSFTQGYLDCAEWLLDDEVDRDRLRGWAKRAIDAAATDCTQFQRENAADLERYEEATGRDMASAGHDFFLTRNHHGAGFLDREGDDQAVLDRLTEASHAYGDADTYTHRNLIYFA